VALKAGRRRRDDPRPRGLPLTIAGETGFAESGGLMEYGPSVLENWRRAAHYVDRLLKGATPGDRVIE
jgi:putative ABC transport system substrate-binding protein